MRRLIHLMTWMTVPLVLAGHLAAESTRTPPLSPAPVHGDQEVQVTADDIRAVATGDGAVAQIRIGNTPAHPQHTKRVTVRVGTIVRKAVGPGAVACVEIPTEEDHKACEE